MIFALEQASWALIGSVTSVILAGLFSLYGVRSDRASKQEANRSDANAVTVQGYHSLLEDQQRRIAEQDAENLRMRDRLRKVESEMHRVKAEAQVARVHADRCDRALAAAEARIAALERSTNGH